MKRQYGTISDNDMESLSGLQSLKETEGTWGLTGASQTDTGTDGNAAKG